MVERQTLIDENHDILSHKARRNDIYIISVDPVLTTDIHRRIRGDSRLKPYRVKRPRAKEIATAVDELREMSQATTRARLLVYDVRRATLPKLRRVLRDITGFNRKDFNKLCYTVLIGDGPPMLFQNGRGLDVFTIYLGTHRVDYHPAVFFFDPLLHYQPEELEMQAIDDEFIVRGSVPQRLIPYFQNGEETTVAAIRRFFRAPGRDEETRKRRQKMLRSLYKKRFTEQFPGHERQLKAWTSFDGLQLATENLHLYPLFFEDWVDLLMQKAQQNALAPKDAEPEGPAAPDQG